ncbi:MAG: DUF4124 domain-containing protein [Burkholderiales bacterium]
MASNSHDMVIRRLSVVCALLMPFAMQAMAAGTYKWVDEKGVTHYSDTLPPQYSKQANTQIDKRGVVTKKTDRALTPTEIEAREQEKWRQKEEAAKAKEQKRQDDLLLATFAIEGEIDLARDRSLEPYDGKIYLARDRIKYLQQYIADQNKELEFHVAAGKSQKKKRAPGAPNALTRDIAASEKEIAELEVSINLLEKDKTKVVYKYSEDKRRFRDVKAASNATAGKPTDKYAIPTWVEVNGQLASDCLEKWQETLGGRAYAVYAEIKREAQQAELVLETRVRRRTGEFVNLKASCPLKSDGSFDIEGIRVKRNRFEASKNY